MLKTNNLLLYSIIIKLKPQFTQQLTFTHQDGRIIFLFKKNLYIINFKTPRLRKQKPDQTLNLTNQLSFPPFMGVAFSTKLLYFEKPFNRGRRTFLHFLCKLNVLRHLVFLDLDQTKLKINETSCWTQSPAAGSDP